MAKRWCAKCGEMDPTGISSCAKCGERSFVYSESMVGTIQSTDNSKKSKPTVKKEESKIESSVPTKPIEKFEFNLPDNAKSRSGQSHEARVAIESAQIVNVYGAYIQIFGIVLGVLIIIGGLVIASKPGLGAFAFFGIVFGLLDIALFAVQGAIFRMISNYVIARLQS